MESLPFELLLNVIPSLNIEDILAVCLTSKRLCAAAQPHLFNVINLDQYYDVHKAKSALFLNQLIDKPAMARLTKQLVLGHRMHDRRTPLCTPLGKGHLDKWFQEAKRIGLIRPTEKKRGVLGRYLSQGWERSQCLLIAALLPNVEEIRFNSVTFYLGRYWAGLAGVTHGFPRLRQITFVGYGLGKMAMFEALITRPTIRILHISSSWFNKLDVMGWDVSFHSNLTTLLLLDVFATPAVVERLVDVCPRLETLAIRHIYWIDIDNNAEEYDIGSYLPAVRKRRDQLKHLQIYADKEILPSLVEFRNLRLLEIYAKGEYEYNIDDGNLPTSLQALHLVSLPTSIHISLTYGFRDLFFLQI